MLRGDRKLAFSIARNSENKFISCQDEADVR